MPGPVFATQKVNDAHEKLPGEVEEAGGRRRCAWRFRGGQTQFLFFYWALVAGDFLIFERLVAQEFLFLGGRL